MHGRLRGIQFSEAAICRCVGVRLESVPIVQILDNGNWGICYPSKTSLIVLGYGREGCGPCRNPLYDCLPERHQGNKRLRVVSRARAGAGFAKAGLQARLFLAWWRFIDRQNVVPVLCL